jgi:hypothetical protein
VRTLIEELRLHAAMEEQVFYPAVQEALGDQGDELVEESLREHAEAKETLEELEALEPISGTFHDRVTALIEEVRHHVDEEEQEILPKLREALDSQVLIRLGEELEGAKMTLLGVAVTAETGTPQRPVPPEALAAGGAEEGVVIGDSEAEAEGRMERLGAIGDREGRGPRTRSKGASATRGAKPTAKKSTAKRGSSATKKSTAKRGSTTTKGVAKKASSPTSGAKRTAATTTSPRLVYHVKPTRSGRWAVARKGAARPSATFDRKPEAVARGRELARRGSKGQLVVHGQDGRIQNAFTYGSDPRRTRG